jgi:alkanesulfonate monooxygenase SsuD/methylene tetrahydromethanopterin reductase-like flavin-dependent oxidoreductase (luciferase family)
MVDACPDEMVDAFTIAGTPDEVRARLQQYEPLADAVKITPPTHLVDAEVTRLAQHNILELFAP